MSLTLLDVDTGTAKFDLLLALEESGLELRGVLEYGTELFDRSTMLRLLHHLETLLGSAVENPAAAVADLALLTEWERAQLLEEWPGAREPYPAEALVPDLLRGWAERGPDRVAVVCGSAALSYGELTRRAGALAARLRGLGVAPETRVGIAAERSLVLRRGSGARVGVPARQQHRRALRVA